MMQLKTDVTLLLRNSKRLKDMETSSTDFYSDYGLDSHGEQVIRTHGCVVCSLFCGLLLMILLNSL